MTAQPTFTADKVRRTKFFFGYRYMWSACQLAEPFSHVAAGFFKKYYNKQTLYIRFIFLNYY